MLSDDALHDQARAWRPGPTRAVVIVLVRAAVRICFAPHVSGRARVPAGPVLIVSNHRSLSDVLFQAAATPRTLRWMAMGELFRTPLQARFFLALGAFPVRRGAGDALTIETARVLLERGDAVAIFPEGRLQFRSAELVGEARSGAGRLALQTGAPVLPMAMLGTDRLWRAALLRRHNRIAISFGETVATPEASRAGFLAGDRDAARRLIVETVWPEVRDQVGALRARVRRRRERRQR